MLFKILLSLGLLPILLSGATHPARHADPGQGFALVELYTSEGCSSCPPADELVAALPKSYPSGVYLLSFHVDYWDRLGWKDPFSNADYTRRQKEYNTALHPLLNNIFTPQVIINGKTELVGSDEPRIRAAIDSELAHTVNPVFDASAHSTDNKTVNVDYTLAGKGAGEFRAALVQVQASTAVKNGENAGKQLRHADIVRDLKSSGKRSGSLKLSLPAGLTPADCKVVVFLQDKENMHIGGAHMLDIH
jgi:hypothetical protein